MSTTLFSIRESLANIHSDTTTTELNAIIEKAKQDCKALTADNKQKYIDSLINIALDNDNVIHPAGFDGLTTMVKSYLLNPFYVGYSVYGPGKDGNYTVRETSKQLSYKALDKAYQKSKAKGTLYQSSNYDKAMTAFIRDCYNNAVNDANNASTKSLSIGEGVKRLQALADTMIPAKLGLTMRRCDAKMLFKVAQTEKNMSFTQRSDSAMENKIILAFGKALKGESYTVDAGKSKILGGTVAEQ